MIVDLSDPHSILWLQQALTRVLPGRILVDPTGQYDIPTKKYLAIYQRLNNLPDTGEPDAETVTKIETDLKELDTLPYKKRVAPPPVFRKPPQL